MSLFGEPKLAMCRTYGCGAPLIATFLFAHAEFYCLECGKRYGFLSPRPAEPTPELVWQAGLEAEWDEHAAPRLRVGAWWLDDCEQCRPHGEYHLEHATDAEREAHDAALEWLAERAGAS